MSETSENKDIAILVKQNEELEKLIRVEIEIAKSKISEKAINKTLKVIYIFGTVTIAFVSIAGVVALLGLDNFKSTMQQSIEGKLERALVFDSQNSFFKSLQDIRTEALINSRMIEYERASSEPYGNSVLSLVLSDAESERILQVLESQETELSTYYDAAKLLAASRDMKGAFGPVDRTGRRIAETLKRILSEDGLSAEKIHVIFQWLNNERSLLPYAEAIIEDAGYSGDFKMIAFDVVARFNKEKAIKFARAEVGSLSNTYENRKLAIYLAKFDPLGYRYIGYAKDITNSDDEAWPVTVFLIALELLEHNNINNSDKEKMKALTLDFMEVAIAEGGALSVLESSFGSKEMVFEHRVGAKTNFRYAVLTENFLDNEKLLNALIASLSDKGNFTRGVKALEVVSDGEYVIAVRTEILGDTKFHLKNGEVLDRTLTHSPVWIKHDDLLGEGAAVVSWRDKIGRLREETIDRIEMIEQSRLFLSYDGRIVRSLMSRAYRRESSRWW